jgi:hypothetical protein
MWRMKGSTVCKLHGGKRPESMANARKRAGEREIQERAAALVAFNENDPETPVEGLLREISWSGQIAQAYAEEIKLLHDEQLVTYTKASGDKMHALVKAHERERTLHARLCKMALDAGIEQRNLDIIEQQAGAIVAVMLALLQSPRLRLSAEQIIEGRSVAAGLFKAQQDSR